MLTKRLISWLDRGDRASFGRAASVVGVVCNLLLVLSKGLMAWSVGSVAMVADAANNLMDALSSVVSLVGFHLARRPADAGHPYGHGRYEYLAGLAVAVLIIVTGVELVRGSIESTLSPRPVAYSVPVMITLLCAVAVKLWLAHFDRVAGDHISSDTLRAAAQDSLNDALATGAVLVGSLISWATGLSLDGPLGLCVGAFVVWSGIDLLRDTINPLIGNRPDPDLVERVRQRILSYPGVLGTHDLMIHDYGPGNRFASAHVEMAAEADPLATHEVIDKIERDLRATEGLVTVLHYDPVVTQGGGQDDLRRRVLHAVQLVDPSLSIHDLYVVETSQDTNLYFDCVFSGEKPLDEHGLEQSITREVCRFMPGARCHITFDEGFAPTTHVLEK